MLPSILEVAERFGLESDPKTYGKKESLFKCPFCREDANKPKKYYLSLNTEENVFKCWYCLESGGVLYFEALLSNQPYEEVRKKYLGERRNVHPALKLSPSQLRKIGWLEVKRKNFEQFQKSKDQVIRDWKIYEYEELVKHYALFVLIANYPLESERKKHYQWFVGTCQRSVVDDLNKKIVQQWNQWNSSEKTQWAIEGEKIAKIALDTSIKSGDFNYLNLFLNVLFTIEILKLRKQQKEEKKISISAS